MLVFSWFICGMLYFLLYSYLFCKLVCKEKFNIDYKNIICCLILAIINCAVLKLDVAYMRPYLMHIFSYTMMMIIYKQSFFKTLIGFLFILIISMISEFIYSIIIVFMFNVNPSDIITDPLQYMTSNILILIISLIIATRKISMACINKLLQWYNKNEMKFLFILVILVITIGTFILYNNFVSILPASLLLLTNLFCIAVFIFVVGFFKEKTNNNKIIYEYDQLLDYVKVYEKLLEDKSKNQHEYKNQLVIIRDIVKKEDRNKYINNILNVETTEEDTSWLRKLKYIPQGGLKGLIYYKIQIMLKNHISVLISVSEELNDIKKWKAFDNNLADISKAIGVYLDNAIEATNETKEKYITISVYLENSDIVFDIANTYSGEIDISKIDKEGYTTKGTGKGYGLSLVGDLINKNEKLEQKRIINGQYYTQKLYIKK